MQAGIEMGIRPKDAMTIVAQSVEGAAQLLLNNEHTHPALEIEKVTTPGGITIKGVNELEHNGFVAQSVEGAAQLLLNNEHTHPALEIEKVTTPGGITIKGVNELEHNGFTSAVIKALKASM